MKVFIVIAALVLGSVTASACSSGADRHSPSSVQSIVSGGGDSGSSSATAK